MDSSDKPTLPKSASGKSLSLKKEPTASRGAQPPLLLKKTPSMQSEPVVTGVGLNLKKENSRSTSTAPSSTLSLKKESSLLAQSPLPSETEKAAPPPSFAFPVMQPPITQPPVIPSLVATAINSPLLPPPPVGATVDKSTPFASSAVEPTGIYSPPTLFTNNSPSATTNFHAKQEPSAVYTPPPLPTAVSTVPTQQYGAPIASPKESRSKLPVILAVVAVLAVVGYLFRPTSPDKTTAPNQSAADAVATVDCKQTPEKCTNKGALSSTEIDLTKDIEKSKQYLEEKCKNNDAKSCLLLGNLLEKTELFVNANNKELLVIKIGGFLYQRSGDTNIPEAALKAYEAACNAKLQDACRRLGLAEYLLAKQHLALQEKKDTNYTEAAAAAKIKSACDNKDAAACYLEGELLKNFNSVRKSIEPGGTVFIKLATLERVPQEVEALFKQSCDMEYAVACRELGRLYIKELMQVSQDEIYSRFEKACALQDLQGCAIQGAFLGVLTRKDTDKAFEILTKTCEKKSPLGCAYLGMLYFEGKGVKKDITQATMLMEDACKQKEGFACRQLGLWSTSKKISKTSFEDTFTIFQMGCNYDDGVSCENLGLMYMSGDGVEKDEDAGVKSFERACDENLATSCRILGSYYKDQAKETLSETTKQNAENALQKACRLGDRKACSIVQ